MNRNTVFNFVMFILLAAVVLGGWWYVDTTFFPKPVQPAKTEEKTPPETKAGPTNPVEKPKPVAPPTQVLPAEPFRLIKLGNEECNTKVWLSTKGAGVQNVVLQAFDHATREGKIHLDDNGQPYPLELIPGYKTPRDPNSVRSKPSV